MRDYYTVMLEFQFQGVSEASVCSRPEGSVRLGRQICIMEGTSRSRSTEHPSRPATGTPRWNNITGSSWMQALKPVYHHVWCPAGLRPCACTVLPRNGHHHVSCGKRHWPEFRRHSPDRSQLRRRCSTPDGRPKSTSSNASMFGGRGINLGLHVSWANWRRFRTLAQDKRQLQSRLMRKSLRR